MGILVKTATSKRLDSLERRMDVVELTMQGLATREQLNAVSASVSEIKGMIQTLIDRQAGNSA